MILMVSGITVIKLVSDGTLSDNADESYRLFTLYVCSAQAQCGIDLVCGVTFTFDFDVLCMEGWKNGPK